MASPTPLTPKNCAAAFCVSFHRLKIKTFFVVVYCQERGSACARLFVAYDRGRPLALPSDSEFDASRLLPAAYAPIIHDGRAFAVIPCTRQDLNLGHIIIELNLALAFCYDVIAEAIACGLYGARLAASA